MSVGHTALLAVAGSAVGAVPALIGAIVSAAIATAMLVREVKHHRVADDA